MFHLPPLIYRGSVKNIRGEVSAEKGSDVVLFEYSDRFSVFDWGEMPDQLTDKGRALSVMGKYFFRYLENPKNWSDLFERESVLSRFDSQYLADLKKSDLYKKWIEQGLSHHALLEDREIPFNSHLMKIKMIDVLRPALINQSYDYSPYNKKPVNALVPLEIIFRLGLPQGNSLSKRMGNNPVLWREFGFDSIPQAGELLKKPVLDFSTKLERGDRYLDYREARAIAGLSEAEWTLLHQMTQLIALNLFSIHTSMGLDLIDGKIEVAFIEDENGKRSFMLVDSIGLDELRLQMAGKSFSKEFLREFYKESKWYGDLEAAKLEGKMMGKDFKKLCLEKFHSEPEQLPPEILKRTLFVYKSYCNALAKKMSGELPFESDLTLENYRARYL